MKHTIITTTFAVLTLSACSTSQMSTENRLACTLAGDQLFFISKYGPVGISRNVAEADRQIVCKSQEIQK